jgi:hypothetical protein
MSPARQSTGIVCTVPATTVTVIGLIAIKYYLLVGVLDDIFNDILDYILNFQYTVTTAARRRRACQCKAMIKEVQQ